MAVNLRLSILTPDKVFFTGEVSEVSTETVNGSIGILPEHSPLVGLLKPTITKFKLIDGTERSAVTSNGVLNVTGEEVKILVDASEWPEDIDVNRAEEAKERAEKRLSSDPNTIDVNRAELALARALVRIKAKGL